MAQATLSCPFGAIHLEDRRGTAQNGHSVSIFAHPIPFVASRHLPLTGEVGPRPPIYGSYPLEQAESFRRAKSEWVSKFPPGHWALGLQKLPLLQFKFRALMFPANAPGASPPSL